MSGPTSPPPSYPPPASGPPPPPPSGPPRRRALPWVVAAVVLVLLLAAGGAVVAFTGGDAGSVEEVADQAVEAAEALDVDAGIDLLCDAPSAEERDELDELIADSREAAGTDEPAVDYAISDVEGDETGSFVVTVTSDEPGLEERDLELQVLVERDGDRSCIDGLAEPTE